MTQLGIFASVGATPKQIKRSVVMEGLMLTVIPLPAILFTILTVWWWAIIPARKIARMSPMMAIRKGGDEKYAGMFFVY